MNVLVALSHLWNWIELNFLKHFIIQAEYQIFPYFSYLGYLHWSFTRDCRNASWSQHKQSLASRLRLLLSTLQCKESVSSAPVNSTPFLTPLSPPAQLLAATLCAYHCHCHCHHRAPQAPTLLLTFPLTKLQTSGVSAVKRSGTQPWSWVFNQSPPHPQQETPHFPAFFSSFGKPHKPGPIPHILAFRNPAASPSPRRNHWPGASPVRQAGLWIGSGAEWVFLETRLMGGPFTLGLDCLEAVLPKGLSCNVTLNNNHQKMLQFGLPGLTFSLFLFLLLKGFWRQLSLGREAGLSSTPSP